MNKRMMLAVVAMVLGAMTPAVASAAHQCTILENTPSVSNRVVVACALAEVELPAVVEADMMRCGASHLTRDQVRDCISNVTSNMIQAMELTRAGADLSRPSIDVFINR